MRSAPASLLRHVGHGPTHFDLVIGYGKQCPTAKLHLKFGVLAGFWQAPHRRRYLSYRGPVRGGRGSVQQVWQGQVWWHRGPRGWQIHAPGLGCIVVHGDALAG